MANQETKAHFRERVAQVTGFRYADIPFDVYTAVGLPGPIVACRGDVLVCWADGYFADHYDEDEDDLVAADFIRVYVP